MFFPTLVLLYKLNTLVLKQKKLPVLDMLSTYMTSLVVMSGTMSA